MANVKKGNLTAATDWWKHLRWFGKRDFWKRERRAHAASIPELLEDDYPPHEAAADNCTPETPCARCARTSSKEQPCPPTRTPASTCVCASASSC